MKNQENPIKSSEIKTKKPLNRWLIAVGALGLVVICLVGYILYDKLVVRDWEKAAQLTKITGRNIDIDLDFDLPKSEEPKQSNNENSDSSTVIKHTNIAEFCTEHERICFKMPSDWQTEVIETKGKYSPNEDYAEINLEKTSLPNNNKNKAIIFIHTGGQLGGRCHEGTTTVLKRKKTAINGVARSESDSDTAYAVSVVFHPHGTNEYWPMMGLTNDKQLIEKDVVNGCKSYIGLVKNKKDGGSLSVNVAAEGEYAQTYFSDESRYAKTSMEAAQRHFEHQNFQKAFDVIAGAYYKR